MRVRTLVCGKGKTPLALATGSGRTTAALAFASASMWSILFVFPYDFPCRHEPHLMTMFVSATGERMRTVRCNERIRVRFVHGGGQKPRVGVEIKLEGALESMLLIMSGRSAAW